MIRRRTLETPAATAPGRLGRATPQLLQVVELPLFRRKEVDDDVAEVQQHPARRRRSLPPVARDAACLEGLGEVFFQRLYLPRRLRRHDDEVIGEERQPPQIKQHDVFSQIVRSDINDELRYFQGFPAVVPPKVRRCGLWPCRLVPRVAGEYRPAARGGQSRLPLVSGAVAAPNSPDSAESAGEPFNCSLSLGRGLG